MPRAARSNAHQHSNAAEALRRCERLHHLSHIIASDLDLERIVQTVTDVATEECKAEFGAFFYNVHDGNGEAYRLYTLSGAPREAFESFGLPRNTAVFEHTFRGKGVVRSDNIRADPRYGKNAPFFGMPAGHLPVVSYMAVPVISRSRTVLGGLFFGHREPGVFTAECEALVVGIAAHAAVAIDNAHLHRDAQREIERRSEAETRLELLLSEVKHRYRNAVGTIQAIASQTFDGASSEAHHRFNARLGALGKALDLLTTRDWDRVAVMDVVSRALAPFEHGKRIRVSGGEATLGPDSSLLVALTLHELATNAVKYGALSNGGGRVTLSWEPQASPERLRFAWQESDGPPVAPPQRSGFGTVLIKRALGGASGAANMEFPPEGVRCTFEAPL
jgi:two-component sensor histidine kinase